MTQKIDPGRKLTPQLLARITRSGKVEPEFATMVVLGVPPTAEAWAEFEYDKPLDELTAEELAEMPEVLAEHYES